MAIANPMRHNVLITLQLLLDSKTLGPAERAMVEHAIEEFDRFDRLYEVCVKIPKPDTDEDILDGLGRDEQSSKEGY